MLNGFHDQARRSVFLENWSSC